MKPRNWDGREWVFFLLRTAIGWHFLYEGCWKLLQKDGWSAASYLTAAQGPLAPLFKGMASQGWMVAAGDWAVQLGLVAIGLGLITGVLARVAALFGIALLALFYGCQPPEPFCTALSGADGRFFLVERNAIEAVGFLLIAATPCWRGFVRTLLPGACVLAVFALCVWHQYRASGFKAVQAVTSATVKVHEFTALAALKRPFAEKARVGGVEISRLALGGDLIAGHAHARDLIWTDEFMRRYNAGVTLGRTVRYALFCGLDTAFAEPAYLASMQEAAREKGGTLKFFANCATPAEAALAKTGGAQGVYTRPETTDACAKANDAAGLKALVAALRETGLPVGVGAEDVATVKFCVAQGVVPDYWVLAFHSSAYPAAALKKPFNSIWCRDPEGTAAYMKTRKEPWVAIRVLAGGALEPAQAYRYAVDRGAAAVAVDLLDYRIVETVNKITQAADKDAKKGAGK